MKKESKIKYPIAPGTRLRLPNGKEGSVVHSDKSYTTVRELEFSKEDFDYVSSITTDQAKELIIVTP